MLSSSPLLRVPRVLAWVGLVAVFFGAIAPTLTWLGFSGGLENLNIATALELRRDHAMTLSLAGEDGRPGWLVPTLEGEARTKKPPLTAWITALAISPETVRDLSNADPAVHEAAWVKLAWQARWPTLLAACLMLIATYELGRAIADSDTALVAAIACGTSIMFLKFARSAMIDVHLGLWVTLANVFLAHAALHGRRWMGCIGGGVCLGIVVLLKGPVGLVQTVLPVIVYLGWRAYVRRHGSESEAVGVRGAWKRWIAPVLVCGVLMLGIALPWYIAVGRLVPGALEEWLHEASAQRGEKPDKVYTYANIFVLLVPWTVSVISGIISARGKMILAVALAIVPLVVMTVYKDRKDRYLVPVLPACAIVSASGVMALARRAKWSGLDKAAMAQHWGILVAVGVVMPAAAAIVLGNKYLPTEDHAPWLARPWGAGLTIGLGIGLAGAMWVRRQWLASLVIATVATMLIAQAAIMPGYARTEAGISPMRPLAQAIWKASPDAVMWNAHPRGKRADVSLSIHLNRPTKWISFEELKKLAPGERAQVVVMMQEPAEGAPVPPEGWRVIGKTQRDKDWWWAFELAGGGRD